MELDVELVELELLFHGVDDLVTDVHGEADRLLVVVEIREWNRRVAMAERNRAGLLDVLQCPSELLGARLPRAERGGEPKAHHTKIFHCSSPPVGWLRQCWHKIGRNRM